MYATENGIDSIQNAQIPSKPFYIQIGKKYLNQLVYMW